MRSFPCGCKFEEDEQGIIYEPDIHKIPLDCPATWDMICEGNTKGVFQLESQLGSSTAAKAKPRNIDELSDLIAIIRPGCLQSFVDGKNLTTHYIDRKNRIEDANYFHPSLEPILSSTYGILVYQEQAILIARNLAGFSLQEADILRKAMGKKKADIMAQVETQFIEKAVDHGIITERDAREIFSWIKASQRYSFNKSHGVSYAYNSYLTAYTKAHFPRVFFTAYLRHADGKPKPFVEIEELVQNARSMDIEVKRPSIRNGNLNFELLGKNPTFGLTNIKGVGATVLDKIEKLPIDLKTCTWDEFLIFACTSLDKTSVEGMIEAGACDCFKLSRNMMMHQYGILKELGKTREIPWLKTYKQTHPDATFAEALTEMVRVSEKMNARERPIYRSDKIQIVSDLIDSIDNPGYEVYDTPTWIAQKEKELLGISITCNKIDEYDVSGANCTCKEFAQGFQAQQIRIAAQIDQRRDWKIKKGQNKGNMMAFLTVSDSSGSINNVTVFTEAFNKYKETLRTGSIVLLQGTKDRRQGGFLVNKVRELHK